MTRTVVVVGIMDDMQRNPSNADIMRAITRLGSRLDDMDLSINTRFSHLESRLDSIARQVESLDAMVRLVRTALLEHVDDPFAHGELVRSMTVTHVTATRSAVRLRSDRGGC